MGIRTETREVPERQLVAVARTEGFWMKGLSGRIYYMSTNAGQGNVSSFKTLEEALKSSSTNKPVYKGDNIVIEL